MDKQANRKVNRVKWIFNPLMIWGAVLGFFIFNSLGDIRDTWRHEGPGYVTHGDEIREKVPENQFKRLNYTIDGLGLAFGVFFWILVAKLANDRCWKSNDKDEYLGREVIKSRIKSYE